MKRHCLASNPYVVCSMNMNQPGRQGVQYKCSLFFLQLRLMQNELSIEEVVQDTANKVSSHTPLPPYLGLVIKQTLKNTQKQGNEYSTMKTYELNYLYQYL